MITAMPISFLVRLLIQLASNVRGIIIIIIHFIAQFHHSLPLSTRS